MKRRKSILFALVGLLLFPGSVLGGKMLKIDKRETVPDDPRAAENDQTFFSARSRENLLQLERKTSFALPKMAIPTGVVDTINILAVRVDFAYEYPDDPNTTGRGTFDLRDTATFLQQEGHAMDPAPHNKHYFEAHLRAMTRYWKVVSNGKLYLDYQVWPQESDSCYHLDSSMGHYGSQPPNFGLGEFFHDALNKAYEVDGGSLDFRDQRDRKKAVVIFHAGADQQTNLWFSETNTPYDLYTGFAIFDSLNWVVLGEDTIAEGIIMPETMTQDNRVTVMNAVMAHEFGHQLGLIDIYNTGSSPLLTQVGDFSLMDNNGLNTAVIFDVYGVGVFGTVPVFPCAWSRAFLGFDEAVEYRQGTSIELAAVKMLTSGTKVARIPISSTEYYLLENRRSDVDGEVEGLQLDSSSNVILGPVKRDFVGDSLIPLREYDLNIPEGSAGIAVWHIDESVAAADYFPFDIFDNNFNANTLQWDRRRRFVRLVEADGNIDFGGNYHRGFGKRQDLFYEGNNTAFSAHTNPPSISNDGGYTHIAISDISAPGMTMTFDLSRDRMAEAFPRRISIPSNPSLSPVAADLDGDGDNEILTVSGKKILALFADGRDFLDSLGIQNDYDTVYSPITTTTDVNFVRPIDTTYVPMPIFAEVQDYISISPVAATFADTTTVLIGTRFGMTYAFLTEPYSFGIPDMFRARRYWNRFVSSSEVKAIIPDEHNNLIHVFHGNGEVVSSLWDSVSAVADTHVTRFSGNLAGACRFGGGMAVVTEFDDGSILYMMRDVSVAHLDNRDTLIADSAIIAGETGFHSPIATDFNRDGIDEIVLLSHNGHVLCYSFDPSGIEKYQPLDIFTHDTAAAGPAAGDFSGNGYPELIIPGTNRLYGYDRQGLTALDFPLVIDNGRTGQIIVSGPIISDISGDGFPDIAVATLDSAVYSKTAMIFYLDTLSSPDTTYLRTKDTTYYYYNYFSNLYVVSPGVFRVDGFPVPAGMYGIKSLQDTVLGVGTPLHLEVGSEGYLVSCGGDGWLNAWRCGWTDESAFWTMAGRTADGAAYLSIEELGQESALSELLPETRFFGYPNPATGAQAAIHYYVNQPARVTVTIFDALGDKVAEMHKEVADGNCEDEIVWNLADVASGVYHCRLEAVALSGSEQAVAFKNIAVVK
jgi:M6 family metalloprotease-like protein